jgi:DNA-binding response OmpR family regulator
LAGIGQPSPVRSRIPGQRAGVRKKINIWKNESPGAGMSLKILTIEDDPMITDFLNVLLTIYEMQVIVANDGATGIQLVRTESPDLILLDLMMPVIDGWEVCQTIRSFSQIPIIVVSAVSNQDKIASALSAGANAFMEKPISIEDLISQIKHFTTL